MDGTVGGRRARGRTGPLDVAVGLAVVAVGALAPGRSRERSPAPTAPGPSGPSGPQVSGAREPGSPRVAAPTPESVEADVAANADPTEVASPPLPLSDDRIRGAIDRWQVSHRPTAFVVAVVKKFGDDRAGRLAALISYYGFFSVFPALLAMVTVLGFLLQSHENLRDSIESSALAQFPALGEDIGASVGEGLTGNWLALIVGIAGAIWAGMGAVQAAQDAMNTAWGVPRREGPNFFVKRIRSLLTLLLVGALIVSNAVVPQLLDEFTTGIVGVGLLILVSIVVDTVVFATAFKLLTANDVGWTGFLPGGVIAAIGYVALQRLGELYVERVIQGAESTYGTFGIVLGLLSWMYLLSRWIMLAVEVDVVRQRRLWPRSLFVTPPALAETP